MSMNSYKVWTIGVFATTFLLTGCTDHTTLLVCSKANPAQEMSRGTNYKPADNDELNREMLLCKVGEFDVTVPVEKKEGEDPEISLNLDRQPFFSTTHDKKSMFFMRGLSVTVQDKDSNGFPDFLSYDTLVGRERVTTILTDRNLDGEFDTKVVGSRGSLPERWRLIQGTWYQEVNGRETPEVLVGGISRKCKEVDGLYVFAD